MLSFRGVHPLHPSASDFLSELLSVSRYCNSRLLGVFAQAWFGVWLHAGGDLGDLDIRHTDIPFQSAGTGCRGQCTCSQLLWQLPCDQRPQVASQVAIRGLPGAHCKF